MLKRKGRPPLPAQKIEEIARMVALDIPMKQIAADTGVSLAKVYQIRNQAFVNENAPAGTGAGEARADEAGDPYDPTSSPTQIQEN